MNLPGIDLGIGAFTVHDHECLKKRAGHGVDAVSQSFVQTAADVQAVRDAAAPSGTGLSSSPKSSGRGRCNIWTRFWRRRTGL